MSTGLARKYVDEALRFLKLSQSKQSKLLYREAPYSAVSFYENLLFALLLLRKKQHEEMLEGKKILQKLLCFQNKEERSFPSDLTDFPHCNDRSLPPRVAYVLEILTKDFGSILGPELSSQIALAKDFLPPFDPKNALCPSDEVLSNPISFGNLLTVLDYFPEYPWKDFLLERACLFWDESAAMYRGPACEVFHAGHEQACTLFDCWMSLHTGIPLKRGWTRESYLDLALVRPGTFESKKNDVSLESEAYSLFITSEGAFAATFLEVKPHLLRGFSPLRFVTAGKAFAWKFPHGRLVSFSQKGRKFYGTVQRSNSSFPLLLEIFVERGNDVGLFVEGGRASLFHPEQGISVCAGKASLQFSILPCGAELLGMVRMGNRSSQLFASQAEEEAFDWVIACERIRGQEVEQFSFCVEMGM